MPTTTDTQAQQALDDLKEEFEKWRKQKKHKRESIPLSLLQKAHALTEHLGHSKVGECLGISKNSFKRLTDGQPSAQPTPTFIETLPSNPLKVDIHLPTGALVSVSQLPDTSAMTIIQQILGGAETC